MNKTCIISLLPAICLCASCQTNWQNLKAYTQKGSLRADSGLVGKGHKAINAFMKASGWNYTEHPNSSANDHPDGKHCEVIFDKELERQEI